MSLRNAWCLVLLATAVAPLCAQRIENLSQGEAVRRAWAPVVQRANRSVVEVAVDGEARALGTVVAADLVVTKRSELNLESQSVGEPPKLTCRQGEREWGCALLAFDRPADLALLRVASARLQPIEWRTDVPAPGAFLATPDGAALPRGVGILASAPYLHTRPRAFLGIRFANPSGGPAEVAEAIEHGAARAAGLRSGDVIVRFDDVAIADATELRAEILRRRPGEGVRVTVRRDDAELTFEVALGTNLSPPQLGQEQIWGELSTVRSGFANVLQHDTILKPADCGGPVVDLTGKAIGVNIARAGRVETLALPAADVQRLVEILLRPAGQPAEGGRRE